MKKIMQNVTSVMTGSNSGKREVVAQIEIDQFDSISEAVEGLTEKTCLELINSQHKTNQMNTARQAAVGKPTKSNIEALAFSRVTTEEFAACQGDPAKIKALLEGKAAEVEKELEAKREEARKAVAARAGQAQTETEAEEEAEAANA